MEWSVFMIGVVGMLSGWVLVQQVDCWNLCKIGVGKLSVEKFICLSVGYVGV